MNFDQFLIDFEQFLIKMWIEQLNMFQLNHIFYFSSFLMDFDKQFLMDFDFKKIKIECFQELYKFLIKIGLVLIRFVMTMHIAMTNLNKKDDLNQI